MNKETELRIYAKRKRICTQVEVYFKNTFGLEQIVKAYKAEGKKLTKRLILLKYGHPSAPAKEGHRNQRRPKLELCKK